MSGTVAGGRKTARTNKKLYGKDYYRTIGAMGGKNGHTGGFASNKIGADGLTGRQRAAIAGATGGRISRKPTPQLAKEVKRYGITKYFFWKKAV